MTVSLTSSHLQRLANRAASKKYDPARHKCFISYHVNDTDEVADFINSFGSEFIAHAVGVTVNDDFVNSTDEEYIKREIREKYLTDSTVTIVLLGRCTWTRKFVDWEISSSLRNDARDKRSGLLVYPLPSMNNSAHLPGRIEDNWIENSPETSYARFLSYPDSLQTIRMQIDEAFDDRTNKSYLVHNSRPLMLNNFSCE